jgi:hypothetical protein
MKLALIIVASLVAAFLFLLVYSCCVIAGRADDILERMRMNRKGK